MYQKSFAIYPVNEIQAYKYNILMAPQSAIASTVTVIAGILVHCGKATYMPSTCTMTLCPVLLYMYFWKVEKVGNLKKIFG